MHQGNFEILRSFNWKLYDLLYYYMDKGEYSGGLHTI